MRCHARTEEQLRNATKHNHQGPQRRSTFSQSAGFSQQTGLRPTTARTDRREGQLTMQGCAVPLGGAQMSPKHPLLLLKYRVRDARPYFEALRRVGAEKRFTDSSGITLEWDIMRIGEK